MLLSSWVVRCRAMGAKGCWTAMVRVVLSGACEIWMGLAWSRKPCGAILVQLFWIVERIFFAGCLCPSFAMSLAVRVPMAWVGAYPCLCPCPCCWAGREDGWGDGGRGMGLSVAHGRQDTC